MGIYNGTVAFQRYLLVGGPRKLTISNLSDLIAPHKAPSLKLDQTVKAERLGWVRPLTQDSAETPLDSTHWDISDCVVEGGVLLRARAERRRVPSTLLQMIFRQKIAEHYQASGKQLNRNERQALKNDLTQELMRRSLPQVSFTDILWKLEDKELYIFNRSKTACERVLQLFDETFAKELKLDVVKFSATSAWVEATDIDARFNLLTKVEPTVFARTLS
jgi:DNA recombination-dependent growth factor C